MNLSMVKHLILKDWYLQRRLILLSLAGGALSLAIIVFGGKAGGMVGLILLISVLIAIGAMLTTNLTVLERKDQTLPFVMALPISYREYTTAKIFGILLIFLIPWSAFMAGSLAILIFAPPATHGLVPFVSIMGMEILVSTCLIAAVGLVTESQGWTISIIMVGNLAFNVVGYLIAHVPSIAQEMSSMTLQWSPAAVSILLAEFAAIGLMLGSTFYLQSRKRDFV